MNHLVFFVSLLLGALPALSQVSFTLPAQACAPATLTLTANGGTAAVSGCTWNVLPAGPVFSAPGATFTSLSFVSPGLYTVELQASTASGSGVSSATVFVAPPPVLQLSQSAFTTCITTNAWANNTVALSKPVTISASGALNYSIQPQPPQNFPNPGGIFTVRPAVSTCYTVSGQDANNCQASALACVTVVPQFTLQCLASNTIRCLPDSVLIGVVAYQGNASGNFQSLVFDWYEPSSMQPPSLTSYNSATVVAYPAGAGIYTVEAHDAMGCASLPASIGVTLSTCLSLPSNAASGNGPVFFPNPVIDGMFLQRLEAPATLRITDAQARELYVAELHEPAVWVELSKLAPGLYQAQVVQNGVTQRWRFVKN